MNTAFRSTRGSRRGTLLVVVLGLLVALFVIGTSFSYVTLSERRAAANYLDRQRALDLALDGVEYSIARLRSEAVHKHFEAIGPATAGTRDGVYEPRLYSLRPLDSNDPSVTWPRAESRTSMDPNAVDSNWIDFDGDGSKGNRESDFGKDKIAVSVGATRTFAQVATGFRGDGINMHQVANPDVRYADEAGQFGATGTYTELGDYFRVRAVDAASLLNINNFRGDHLTETLMILGGAIDDWITGGNARGEYNPFPREIAEDIRILHENLSYIITSKDQLRPVFTAYPRGDQLFELAMNFVTVNSWQDPSYRDWVDANTEVKEGAGNPLKLTEQELWREGYTGSGGGQGREGWPDWQPDNATGFQKAPINVNTAPKPVLVCLFANLEARSRLLYFKRQSQITEEDKLLRTMGGGGAKVYRQNSGTTDWGRQNNRTSGPGSEAENLWYPAGEDNRAIFQLVPIGPITTRFGGTGGQTSSAQGGGQEIAGALADLVISLRTTAPFTSWQDFDFRFCQLELLKLPRDRGTMRLPDLVGVQRGTMTGAEVSDIFPRTLLPDAGNCNHAANPIRSSDSAMAMSPGAFRAWYWKSAVDMIRAALNPNNVTARYNPDYPYFQNVDRMDLTRTNAPICFSSNGIYEVISQGEILAKGVTGENYEFVNTPPVARRQVRTVVQIYDVLRHTSQRDFMSPLDPIIATRQNRPADVVETLVRHTSEGTKSYPFSIDELSNGSWASRPVPPGRELLATEDSRNIRLKPNEPAKDRWKGYNPYTAASGDHGYIAMEPQDRTPIPWMSNVRTYPLNFHARFNESLIARSPKDDYPVQGINAQNKALRDNWGHFPWEKDSVFDDFISSATPRSIEASLRTGGDSTEFQNAADGAQATKYANLQPDGVRLTGGGLRARFIRSPGSLEHTFNKRGLERMPRLKILRYPCAAQGDFQGKNVSPFCPIRDHTAQPRYGVDDSLQTGASSKTSPDVAQTRLRLVGNAAPFRGTDNHNVLAQGNRQRYSNMPYYEGTVDFWIKWDLPPQGSGERSDGGPQNQVVAMGEIDPASHNFSGLFGATAYGRFSDIFGNDAFHTNFVNASSTERNSNADFEGVQFFVYKEPGGVFRFTRLYFSEALGMNVSGGATGGGGQIVQQFGSHTRRVIDLAQPWGGYTATNDICNDVGIGNTNLGFLYARTDAWVNLADATIRGEDGVTRLVLRVHDWHRFTLSYNSNTNQPYQLFLDGREVSPVEFRDDPDGLEGFRNDGSHVGPGGQWRDQDVPQTNTQNSLVQFYRTTTKLLEINPEDRLTVGCVFRRQPDNASQQEFDRWYAEVEDDSVNKPSRPVFKFDSNLVAVANATLDDFRISSTRYRHNDANIKRPSKSELEGGSRYRGRNEESPYFEQGFLPIRGQDGQLHALPVRLGTISWTEYRPDWDPQAVKGIKLETSNRLQVEWAVFASVLDGNMTGGREHNLAAQGPNYGSSGDRTGVDPRGDDYWASGGMSLRGTVLPSGLNVGVLIYRVTFKVGEEVEINNVSAILDDVRVTVLTPPRRLNFIIDF